MKLYHKTMAEAARTILLDGFQDRTGYYMTETLHAGVWLSDSPLDVNSGGLGGESLLVVTFDGPEGEIADFEWIEEGKGYREWLIPAALVNSRMTVRPARED
jgi:hypothetical protein